MGEQFSQMLCGMAIGWALAVVRTAENAKCFDHESDCKGQREKGVRLQVLGFVFG
jgi:hypothetical protein